jgi:DNA-binding response OmpR family regulator
MSENPAILLVEHDLLIRQPLAEYLRECGYKVIEAIHTDEAIAVLSASDVAIDLVLADVRSPGQVDGFGLAHWIRSRRLPARVVLAGTVKRVAATAEQLCENGPLLSKPYDHALLHDRITRELAARNRPTE